MNVNTDVKINGYRDFSKVMGDYHVTWTNGQLYSMPKGGHFVAKGDHCMTMGDHYTTKGDH